MCRSIRDPCRDRELELSEVGPDLMGDDVDRAVCDALAPLLDGASGNRRIYANNVHLPMQLIFVESPVFSRLLPDYLNDAGYRALLEEPDKGAVMPGTGGFRKLRWADTRRGKGKRGGLRVVLLPLGG